MTTRRSTVEVYNELMSFEAAMDQRFRVMEERMQQLMGGFEQLALMLFNEQRGWMPQLQRDIRDVPAVLHRTFND